MDENLLTVKTMIATFFTALGAFLGWKGVMLAAWVAYSFGGAEENRLNYGAAPSSRRRWRSSAPH